MKQFLFKLILTLIYSHIKNSGYRIKLLTQIKDKTFNIFCFNHTSIKDILFASVILNKKAGISPVILISPLVHQAVLKYFKFLKGCFNAIEVVRKKDNQILSGKKEPVLKKVDFGKQLLEGFKKSTGLVFLPEGRKNKIKLGAFRFRKVFDILTDYKVQSKKDIIFHTGIIDHQHKIFVINFSFQMLNHFDYGHCRQQLYQNIYNITKYFQTYPFETIKLLKKPDVKVVALDFEGVLLNSDYLKMLRKASKFNKIEYRSLERHFQTGDIFIPPDEIGSINEFVEKVYEQQVKLNMYKEIYDLIIELKKEGKAIWLVTHIPAFLITPVKKDLNIDFIISSQSDISKRSCFMPDILFNRIIKKLSQENFNIGNLFYLASYSRYEDIKQRIGNTICINPKKKTSPIDRYLETSTLCV